MLDSRYGPKPIDLRVRSCFATLCACIRKSRWSTCNSVLFFPLDGHLIPYLFRRNRAPSDWILTFWLSDLFGNHWPCHWKASPTPPWTTEGQRIPLPVCLDLHGGGRWSSRHHPWPAAVSWLWSVSGQNFYAAMCSLFSFSWLTSMNHSSLSSTKLTDWSKLTIKTARSGFCSACPSSPNAIIWLIRASRHGNSCDHQNSQLPLSSSSIRVIFACQPLPTAITISFPGPTT